MPRSNQITSLAVVLMLVLSWGCNKDNDDEIIHLPALFTADVIYDSSYIILSAKISNIKSKIERNVGFYINEDGDSDYQPTVLSSDSVIGNVFYSRVKSSVFKEGVKYNVVSFIKSNNNTITGNKVGFYGFSDIPPRMIKVITKNPTWGEVIKIQCEGLSLNIDNHKIVSYTGFQNESKQYDFTILSQSLDTLMVKIPDNIPTFNPTLSLTYKDVNVHQSNLLKLAPPIIFDISTDSIMLMEPLRITGKYFQNNKINYSRPTIEIFNKENLITIEPDTIREHSLYLNEFVANSSFNTEIRVRYLDAVSNAIPINVLYPEYYGINKEKIFYGDTIVVRGKYFPKTIRCTIGGNLVQYESYNHDSIVYIVPRWLDYSQNTKTFALTLSVNGYSVNDIIPMKKPVIESITPSSGIIGDIIAIRGRYFSNYFENSSTSFNTVWFGDSRAEIISCDSTMIKARIPINCTDMARVSVQNDGLPSDALDFTLQPITFDGFSTTDAQFGTTTEIYGQNFPFNKEYLTIISNNHTELQKPIQVYYDGKELEVISSTNTSIKVRFNHPDLVNSSHPLKVRIGTQERITDQKVNFTTPWEKIEQTLPNRSKLYAVNGIVMNMNGKGYIGLDGEYILTYNNSDNYSANLLEFDPVTRTFTEFAKSPFENNSNGRYCFGLPYGDTIIAFIGNTLYKHSDDGWQQLPNANSFSSFSANIYGGFIYNNNIYVLTSIYFSPTQNSETSSVYKYNLETHEDTILPNPMPDLSCQVGLTYNDKVYILSRNDNFYEFDAINETWSELPVLPGSIEPQVRYAFFEYQGIIYAFTKDRVFSFNPNERKWTSYQGTIPFDGRFSYALSFDDQCFVGGGVSPPEKTKALFKFFPEFLKEQ